MESLKRYGYHIDEIRRQKGMKVKTLCEGICSDRSYRRYISGERQLPQSKIFAFCNKLEISPTDFFQTFLDKDTFEFQKIYKLYRKLIEGDIEYYKQEYRSIDEAFLVNKMNQKFYRYTVVRYKFHTNQITKYTALDLFSKIIDYPECISNNIFDFSDISILMDISKIESSMNVIEFPSMKILERILSDESVRYITGKTKNVLPETYATVSEMYGVLNDVATCKKIAVEGIKYSLKHGMNFSLTKLYYLHSWTLFMEGHTEQAYLEAVKCLGNAISLQNEYAYKAYYKLIKDDFKIEPRSFFDMYFNKNK